ncbi:hypothetical protein HYX05_03595 [Candidatus Woesearchaeota archaeon]|nr:hypothetical protein [Candidatus Woesearchaeota archaeon]
MVDQNGYLGIVQQSGPGVFIIKPTTLAVIRAGEGQDARHLYIALLGTKTQLELKAICSSSKQAMLQLTVQKE